MDLRVKSYSGICRTSWPRFRGLVSSPPPRLTRNTTQPRSHGSEFQCSIVSPLLSVSHQTMNECRYASPIQAQWYSEPSAQWARPCRPSVNILIRKFNSPHVSPWQCPAVSLRDLSFFGFLRLLANPAKWWFRRRRAEGLRRPYPQA